MDEGGTSAPRTPGLEEALRESEERFRRAFEFAGIGMAILGIDGRWIRVNRALCDMLGYAADELQATTFQALTHPDDMTASVRGAASVVKRETSVMQMEKRYRHKNGAYIWARLTTSVVHSPEGEPLHYISQIEDVDARKRAEAAHRASDERLRTVVEHAPDGIFIYTHEHLIYANAVGASMFGADSPDALVGQSIVDLTHVDFRASAAQRRDDQAKGLPAGAPVIGTYLRLDGTSFEAESKSVPFPMGSEHGTLVFLRDISERRRLEDHLRQMQKIEGIGLLAGGLAHDFNNILAVMTLQLGTLLDTASLDPGTHETLKELDDQARRATGLIRQLLMFSRRSIVNVRSLDLNHAVDHVLKMVRRLIGETVDVHFEPSPTIASIEADAGMVEQVVMNLAVNARDAMPRGGRLTLTTGVVDIDVAQAASDPRRRPGRFTTLTVTDTGTGMDEATQQRIFEPFFTTKAPGKGTGLGLATVYGIVEQHRGFIDVTSEVGNGTSIRLHFPSLTSASADHGAAETSSSAGKAVKPAAGGRTILLVEDEEIVRRVVSRCLRLEGYGVLEASTASEASRLWEERRDDIDLLFTDNVMPGAVHGLEFATRALEERPRLKVIVSSGYVLETPAEERPSDARISYLPKPFEIAALRALVRDCIGRP